MIRILLLAALLLVATDGLAGPYAPLADVSRVDESSNNLMAMRLADATVPEAGTVGVAAYPGAEIVLIRQFANIREGRYQNINLLRLYTSDDIDTVKARLKSEHPDWVWRETEQMRALTYPVQGASTESDLPGNPDVLMSGPRVSLSDIDRDNHPFADEIKEFGELAPGARTEIKIEFPGVTVDLIRVDQSVIDGSLRRCSDQERVRLGAAMANNFSPSMPEEQRQQTLARLADQQCAVVERLCSTAPDTVPCQRLLQLYES